jgi:hypothetical protein
VPRSDCFGHPPVLIESFMRAPKPVQRQRYADDEELPVVLAGQDRRAFDTDAPRCEPDTPAITFGRFAASRWRNENVSSTGPSSHALARSLRTARFDGRR